jgi:hypothetical protein
MPYAISMIVFYLSILRFVAFITNIYLDYIIQCSHYIYLTFEGGPNPPTGVHTPGGPYPLVDFDPGVQIY